MLQSSFNIIKQHFSPNSQINKNIFITKDYDYPSPFFQRLYLSYLELQQTVRTRPSQQIAKRINMVTNKNDKNFEKTILGFVYAILLHYPTASKTSDSYEKQKGKLLDSTYDLKIQSQKILNQLTQYFTLFRNQTWVLFTHIALEIILNHFTQIKSIHRCGFIAIFRHLQKFSVCQDDYFMAIMKTLNFYDQKNWATKYNLELIGQLNEIINGWKKSNEMGVFFSQEEMQKNFSRGKMNEQMSLMRHYLFGKLIHWQYMTHKLGTYLKGEWPCNLQRTCTEALKTLKYLYQSNPEQCLVFSGQFVRYTQFPTQDYQMKKILSQISQSSQRSVNEQLIGHHFSLVPIATQFIMPYQIQQQLTQMTRILYPISQQQVPQSRVQKHNVHMIMGWVWKQCLKQFSQEKNKNYLIENAYQDLVRWCLMSNTKNLELRSFVIEWVMYNTGHHNEALSKSVKEAFFWDWLYYLKVAQQIDINSIFGILTASIHILNYFAFCATNLAEGLFLFILGKGIILKTQYQTGNISQGMFRTYINEVLKRANREGILRVKQILYQSQLSNFIKSQLELRIHEGDNAGVQKHTKDLEEKQKELPNDRLISSDNIYGSSIHTANKIIQQRYPQVQKQKYYGDKELEIRFDLKEDGFGNVPEHEEQEDLIYTSHELIPSSPTYHEVDEPHYGEANQEDHHGFSLELNTQNSVSFKRDYPSLSHKQEEQQLVEKPRQQAQQSQKHNQTKTNQLSLTNKQKLNQKPSSYQIRLQKQFFQEMGPSINLLIQSPTVHQFTEYMKQLIKVLKEYKKSSQQEEMIQKFLQQTTKILYLIFNKEFESFDFSNDQLKETKDSRFLSYFLLKSIHQNWKQALVIYNVFVYKKLVKFLCNAFPSAKFTFYYVFLDIFKKGAVHYKEMKSWLFVPQREKIVIPVLRKLLGDNFKLHIYENAQVLKIQ